MLIITSLKSALVKDGYGTDRIGQVSQVQMIKWPSVYSEPQTVNAVIRLISHDIAAQGHPLGCFTNRSFRLARVAAKVPTGCMSVLRPQVSALLPQDGFP